MATVAAVLALAVATGTAIVLAVLAQQTPDARGCRAAGGHWRTFAQTCDYRGLR